MFEFGTAGSCHGGGVGEESALASTVSATHAHPLGPPGVGLSMGSSPNHRQFYTAIIFCLTYYRHN